MKIKTEGIYTGEENLEYKLKFSEISEFNLESNKPTVLLHSCCGPCSTAVVERLAPNYNVTVFFYNPNIMDREEYYLRRDNQLKFLEAFNYEHRNEYFVDYLEGEYTPDTFVSLASDLKDEPEGGLRCSICFKLRLEKTAEVAKALDKDLFATTLTVSPHKNYQLISAIGSGLSQNIGIKYLDENFKKKGGFQRSIELSKKYSLYRQSYCGCNYSK
ncbi:MAG: epoxyqueuosine reductase QueH [Peptostreptococcaceae bacterium]|nr:epoxyqueuosine reductase QueH [Peptostreptococcaceae bacterium]